MAERVRLLAGWLAAVFALLVFVVVMGGYGWLIHDIHAKDDALRLAAMEDMSTTLWLLLAALLGVGMPAGARAVSNFARSFRSRHDR